MPTKKSPVYLAICELVSEQSLILLLPPSPPSLLSYCIYIYRNIRKYCCRLCAGQHDNVRWQPVLNKGNAVNLLEPRRPALFGFAMLMESRVFSQSHNVRHVPPRLSLSPWAIPVVFTSYYLSFFFFFVCLVGFFPHLFERMQYIQ